ncbi:MAG TPA: alpha/beta hydrolase [Acidimicrobiales bacterium]|nr:alpha/beta hydrolase [Acidimicrobiales bacterium]
MTAPRERSVALSGGPVELIEWPGSATSAPLVLLHEGLGSARLWRSLPAELAERTGRTTVAWSRHGYGGSAVVTESRPPTYMHQEALVVLPELLAAVGLDAPVLVGHSDGASIALIHAGAGRPVSGIVAIAPHVMVEERSLAGIREARERFETTDLRNRLARHHRDPEATFRGWNDIWLSPRFRDWNIEEYLATITAPVLAIQAADDEYGTLDQVDRIGSAVAGRFERLVLPTGGHSPHVSRSGDVLEAVVRFVGGLP